MGYIFPVGLSWFVSLFGLPISIMDTLVLCSYIVLCSCHFPFTLISYFLMHLQLRFVVIDSRNRSQLFGLIQSVKRKFSCYRLWYTYGMQYVLFIGTQHWSSIWLSCKVICSDVSLVVSLLLLGRGQSGNNPLKPKLFCYRISNHYVILKLHMTSRLRFALYVFLSFYRLFRLGLMPKVTPCMQRLAYDMMQCYREVGLNPDMFSPRGSRMEGAIIGDNREVAKMFCS